MQLTSPAFQHNQMIPAKYTCQGEDINPVLLIKDIPSQSKSLVLMMDDPDAPGSTWDHWIIFNIAPTIQRIEEDTAPGTQGKNSWGRNDYGGPCPPSGTHRYFFKLYALNQNLNLKEGVRKREVEQAMDGHVIEKAELIGLYKKF
jgi:Raf kinase inhibitor-like YbhB/YbcL family protein